MTHSDRKRATFCPIRTLVCNNRSILYCAMAGVLPKCSSTGWSEDELSAVKLLLNPFGLIVDDQTVSLFTVEALSVVDFVHQIKILDEGGNDVKGLFLEAGFGKASFTNYGEILLGRQSLYICSAISPTDQGSQ